MNPCSYSDELDEEEDSTSLSVKWHCKPQAIKLLYLCRYVPTQAVHANGKKLEDTRDNFIL